MRKVILAVAVLALAASCGPKASEGEAAKEGGDVTSGLSPAGFPMPSASYVAKYKMSAGSDAQPSEMTIYASGGKRRIETAPPSGLSGKADAMAMVMDSNQRWVTFPVGPTAPKVAMVMSLKDMGGLVDQFDPKDTATTKPVGSDTVAGLRCRIWESPPAEEGKAPQQTCVTDDGIFLRTNEAGKADAPQLIATEVKKGAQDASLFGVPAGYEVVDMGPCMALMAGAMEAMKSGQKPDMAKMAECQKLGAKTSALFGGR